ncbi:MAG: DUF362 domain-containing protein [Proteobacteria bacterium]|nr:DUF362 domain-containing protein [Pseudomonadota bacterium]
MLTDVPHIPVALLRQTGYDRPALRDTVERVLTACGLDFARGERVLVKPNLVSRNNAALSCTHPEVVRAVCEHLLDCAARPMVADSPAFGSAGRVAAACGLAEALRDLGLRVATLDRPTPLKLTDGGSIGLSRRALEADRILSVARLKAHCQFRVTASTKNLFGTVCGCRKALAHMRLGELSGRMERLVLDVRRALPPAIGIVDGIVTMHRGGPVHGEAFALGLLGCSPDTLALDAALYGLLGLKPSDVPLWTEALIQKLPGADPLAARFVLAGPETFDATGFEVQAHLSPMRFEPLRFMRGRVKSLLDTLR